MINQDSKKEFSKEHGAAIYTIAIGILMGLSLILSFFLIFYLALTRQSLTDDIEQFFSLLTSIAVQAGFVIFYIIFNKKVARPDYGLKLRISPVWYAAGAIFALICLFCFLPVSVAFENFLSNRGFEFTSPFEPDGISKNILITIGVVIAAPIGEELIFRSGLLSGLKKRFSNIPAAALSGLCFSLMHMNPAQTVYQFFLGFAAAYLVLSCGSVIPAIIFHSVSNLTIVLTLFFNRIENVFNLYEAFFLGSKVRLILSCIFLSAIGAAAIFFGCNLLKKILAAKQQSVDFQKFPDSGISLTAENTLKKNKIFYTLLCAGLGVSAAMWVYTLISL